LDKNGEIWKKCDFATKGISHLYANVELNEMGILFFTDTAMKIVGYTNSVEKNIDTHYSKNTTTIIFQEAPSYFYAGENKSLYVFGRGKESSFKYKLLKISW
jgi:hypothetical protein